MVSLQRLCSRSLLGIAAFLVMGGLAQATTISLNTLTIGAGDPTQSGRLSRNGVPQDWSGGEAFPGVINIGTSYHYMTLDLDITALEAGFNYGGFIQLDFDSIPTTTFLSAYLDSYSPANMSTNFLGDAGTSGNFFGVDPLFFQVVVPSGHHLVLVLNETATNAGLNLPGALTVEAFADTDFTDLTPASTPVPEPASLTLLASGIALLARRRLRRGTAA
jgi:hypothetical protein